MINILVTGANGQLGKEISNIASNYKKYKFFFTDVDELDITKATAISSYVNSQNISFIINCAAYTAVDKAEEDHENAYKINVIGPENLKNEALKKDIPFIHISTDYVFDGKNYKPYIESDKTNPQGVYGKTKLHGEERISSYKKCIIIRTSWLYSIYGNNFVKTITRIAKENPEISVVVDQIGSPTNAADLALAILKITNKIINNEVEEFGIFHFSNEGVCSWFDFAKAIVDISKIDTNVIAVNSDKFPRPAPRPFYSVLDKNKIKKKYGLLIPFWRDSLKDCITKL